MVNKSEKEIGILNVFSWENFALTGRRYCQNVDELKWLLPNPFFKKLLTLQQEFILSDCVQLNPLLDYSKRNIYIKSKSFKKSLTEESKEFAKNDFPFALGVSDLFGIDLIYALDFGFEHLKELTFKDFLMDRKSDELSNWDEYVFKNTGYTTERFRKGDCNNLHYEFWVPGLNCIIKQYYYVQWQPVFGEDEVLKILFGADQ